MRFSILLTVLCASVYGANINNKRGSDGGRSSDQGSGWSEWASSTSRTTLGPSCSIATVISTVQPPCPPIVTATVTIETTRSLQGPTITVTSDTTLPGRAGVTVTSTATSTIETTTTVSGGSCCGGVTTVVNNYYGNKTTTYTSTYTSTYTETVTSTIPTHCPPTPSCPPGGTINIDALLVALKAYFDTTFIEELNATLVESLEISLFQSLNESLSISLNDSLSLSLSETISNDFTEIISLDIDNSVHNAIHAEFTSQTLLDFEENITSIVKFSVDQSIHESIDVVFFTSIESSVQNAIHAEFTSQTFLDFEEQFTSIVKSSVDQSIHESIDAVFLTSLDKSINTSIDKSIHASFDAAFITSLDDSVHNAIRAEFASQTFLDFEENFTNVVKTSVDQSIHEAIDTDNMFLTNIDNSIRATISKVYNEDLLTNINQTVFGAFQDNVYNTDVILTLNQTSLHYMNKSITDVVLGYMDNQFTDRTSSFYADMSQITQAYAYDTSPWYAIAILTLLIIFGILTLAGLLWLILRNRKHHKKMGNCPDCDARQDQCACGT